MRDKSFVDDLIMEPGIVSMRVGSALRSTEIKPVAPRFVSWNQSDGLFKSLDVFFFLHSNQPVGVGVQAAASSIRAGRARREGMHKPSTQPTTDPSNAHKHTRAKRRRHSLSCLNV